MRILATLVITMFLLTPLTAVAETPRTPVTLQTTEGNTIKGTVSGIRDGAVSLVTEFGVVRVPLEKLTAESRKTIEQSGDGEAAALRVRVAELEALVEKLRDENAALRRQTPPSAPAPQRFAGGGTTERVAPTADAGNGGYWISNTGKRHNSRCRYYQNSQGRKGGANEGVGCKICGG